MIIFAPDDEVSKAFAEAYYDGSQELSFLGEKVIAVKDEDVEKE